MLAIGKQLTEEQRLLRKRKGHDGGSPIPKGFRIKAQGCRAIAWLPWETKCRITTTLKRLRNEPCALNLQSVRKTGPLRNPYWVVRVLASLPQGSRAFCAATLGFVTGRLWRRHDARLPDSTFSTGPEARGNRCLASCSLRRSRRRPFVSATPSECTGVGGIASTSFRSWPLTFGPVRGEDRHDAKDAKNM